MRARLPLEPAAMTPAGVPLTRTRAEFVTDKI
jgi:hypothetical protein